MFKSLSTIEFNALGGRSEFISAARENLESSLSHKAPARPAETSNFAANLMGNYRGCEAPVKRSLTRENRQTSNLTTGTSYSSKPVTRARQTTRSRSKCSQIVTVREEKENVSPAL